jgi:hypothetical protein
MFSRTNGVRQYLTEKAARATCEFQAAATSPTRIHLCARGFHRRIQPLRLYRCFREEIRCRHSWPSPDGGCSNYFVEHYIRPTGRNLTGSQIEWSAHAEKHSPECVDMYPPLELRSTIPPGAASSSSSVGSHRG